MKKLQYLTLALVALSNFAYAEIYVSNNPKTDIAFEQKHILPPHSAPLSHGPVGPYFPKQNPGWYVGP